MKWSVSTHYTMRRCSRQFVYAHVLAAHGANDPLRKEAYILKQLKNVEKWKGDLVHQVLQGHFDGRNQRVRRPDPHLLTMEARRLAEQQLEFSRRRSYREPGMSKSQAGEKYYALFEHEYEQDIQADIIDSTVAVAETCFTHLASRLDIVGLILNGSRHRTEMPLNFYLSSDLPVVRGYIDLLFEAQGGYPVVIDWKVVESETSDYSRQLMVYALGLPRLASWSGVDPLSIRLYEVNLLQNYVREHTVTAQALDDASDFVFSSLLEEQALIGDRAAEEVDVSEFDVAGSPNTCCFCNFQRICQASLPVAAVESIHQPLQSRLFA